MADLEALGVFYLGRQYDVSQRACSPEPVLYDARDLTTHAVCVGMTGSGKTGLCLALLEEAALDGVPAICIDPKGDLGNLLLAFPELRTEDFEPWIDPQEAARQGQPTAVLAEQTADQWRKGLAEWGQDGARIARFKQAADVCIYTPGSDAGVPLAVFRSLAAPPAEVRNQGEAFRERIAGAVGGLLALLGLNVDPVRSREHILLSNLLETAWKAGQDLDLPALIRQIQNPPFQQVGFMDLESFFPAKERFELALSLNNLLAAPGFSAWLSGEPLDIQRLLYSAEGKPRLSIINIAHLSDSERMFFVTLLLNELLAWMRTQPGTSSLRALLYMDEVFGYFPPTANPPSKTPMLTLLKQARAFGLGIVLATQNPVDLDYKGLANAGTWFLGRLQTERDKLRVLEGLESASAATGHALDRNEMETLLSSLSKRVFLLHNVHEEHPVVFQSRWALSYLCGPLGREQISRLMAPRKAATATQAESTARPNAEAPSATGPSAAVDSAAPPESGPALGERPVLPPHIAERFLPCAGPLSEGQTLCYRPAIYARASVHYTQARLEVDFHEQLARLAEPAAAGKALWDQARPLAASVTLGDAPAAGAQYAAAPSEWMQAKSPAQWASSLRDQLYRTLRLTLWKCPLLKQTSRAGETLADFRARLAVAVREARDAELAKLRKKYAPKLASLQQQLERAQERAHREQAQASEKTMDAVIRVGSSILGAVLGRKLLSKSNASRAGSSARAANRAARERADAAAAETTVSELTERIAALEEEFKAEAELAQVRLSAEHLPLEEVQVAPKKSAITVEQTALAWCPWIRTGDGPWQPGWSAK